MPAIPNPRYSRADPSEPVMHDLCSIPFGDESVAVRLVVRRSEDAAWRGRLLFGAGEIDQALSTAEIFFGATEPALWEAVRDLPDHHIRDLYRSLIVE